MSVNRLATALNLPILLGPRDRYLVRTEFPGREAIVDICLHRPGDFIIFIENKIWY